MSQPLNPNTPSGNFYRTGTTPDVNVDVNAISVGRPIDRVRWGPIVAGFVTVLATLTVLGVLGTAIGLSAYDPGDNARAYGTGAAIWAGVSALLAFFIGGWLAARSAAVRGSGNGLLNGAMVWALATPLALFLLAAAGSMLGSRATMSTGDSVNNVIRATVTPGASESREPRENIEQKLQNSDENTVSAGRKAAWGTFISLLLGLGAATVGGLVGARSTWRDEDHDEDHSTYTTPPTRTTP